jgi:hypothetical protein
MKVFNVKSVIQLLTLARISQARLQVFILAGQSNMVGMASIQHLNLLIESNATPNIYRDWLWNESSQSFNTRDDVFIRYQLNGVDAYGGLTVNVSSGFAATNNFGPELGFGWTLGDHLDRPVLLIKTAWGGKNLAVDFRPPSAGIGNYSGIDPSSYGIFFRQSIHEIIDTLSSIETYVPGYKKEDGFDLAGYVWFQGWNDMLTVPTVNEYGGNLIKFIRDVRRDLDAPDLPFIIGELGMHGTSPSGEEAARVEIMRATEKAVTLLLEFRNNTVFVSTHEFAVMNGTTYNGIYHYYGRADTYFHIGEALGQGALKLMTGIASAQPPFAGKLPVGATPKREAANLLPSTLTYQRPYELGLIQIGEARFFSMVDAGSNVTVIRFNIQNS